MPVPLIGRNGATDHKIAITFADDHSFNGVKLEVIGVTPEQIAAAIFHLQRVAHAMVDAMMTAARQNDAEIAATTRAIAAERKG